MLMPAIRNGRFFACLALALLAAGPDARAAGDLGLDDHHDEGPSYFGFVKDARGAPIADAKVTASFKNGLAIITRTTALGSYTIGSMSKDINLNEVTISCAKEGYRQTRVLRRTARKVEPGKPIETECRMERG
jgi:hypothetical protein